MVCMDRATRCRWERPCGRQDRTRLQPARRLWCDVRRPTSARTRRTEGERREGRLWFERWRDVLRHGKRGRPTNTLRTGVPVRLKKPGSHQPTRGRQRPKYQAPSPEHPDPAQPLATKDRPAHHREACHTSLRRRCSASRRRTHTSAKDQARLQERWEVYGSVPHLVRVHFTTRPVPAVA